MSDHLFKSITVPDGLSQLVDFFGFHVDTGSGQAPRVDGWRAFLRNELANGPIGFLACASEHLEHFGDQVVDATEELIGSPWSEVVSLGLSIQALQGWQMPRRPGRSDQPQWLTEIESCRVVQASVRDDSLHPGPTPWIVEVDFGLISASCMNVWIHDDGSLHQLYPSDAPIEDLEDFLGQINHLNPNMPFVRLPPVEALDAFCAAAEHRATAVGAKAMLGWLLRTSTAACSQ